MKKWMPWAIIGGVLLLLLLIVGANYNSLVSKREQVKNQFSNLEAQYQRRSDLVPNLVSTVKGSANFEQETLTQVVEARAKATSIQVDPANLSSDQIKQFQSAQGELSSALSRLLVVAENYPQLGTTQAFRDLQVQLEGTENRITVARRDYNEATNTYNVAIKTFPSNITAMVFGFDEAVFFEADEGTQKAPTVNFGQ